MAPNPNRLKAAPAIPIDPERAARNRELATRYPDKVIKRFTAPAEIRTFRTIAIREVDTNDEWQAALYADAVATDLQRKNTRLMMALEEREAQKLAIVEIDGHLVDHSIPLVAADSWPQKTWAAIQAWYAILNGIPMADVGKAAAEAEVIGGPAPVILSGPASGS
jgi:hypothetical protein